ncbi:MAG: ATP-binding protein [Spirochaetes bacterium]|nr:ATP-binding protein [Spirochaetota bacterium]
MLEEYKFHNLFWTNPDVFLTSDPHLSQLRDLKFVHPMNWWIDIDWKNPGIFILTGGRQIGKSTSTKILIKHLIKIKRFLPEQIFYLPCDQIDDHHNLTRIIRTFIDEQTDTNFLIILDEITFVRGWDKGIKALADEGHFRNGFCILTGSDTVILKNAAARFPGRRGNADKVDFHIFPLSFKEYVLLTEPMLIQNCENQIEKVFASFNKYLKCGGFLRAINELHSIGEIRKATYMTFEQWIKGDFQKRGKRLNFLQDILAALYKTAGTQVTFSNLTSATGTMTKDTFIDYSLLLQRMDIIHVLEAFDQNTLKGFPKKAKKIHFADPFIIDVIGQWLQRERYIHATMEESNKVESITASNLISKNIVYYIKADGEIDIVLVKNNGFIPIEIKWTGQLRPSDLKQIRKYNNSLILTKQRQRGIIENIETIPLPLYLLQ